MKSTATNEATQGHDDMTKQDMLNAKRQDRLADLIIEHRLTASAEDRYFQKWLETDDKAMYSIFKVEATQRRKIEAELLVEYGVNLEAATTRRLAIAFNTAA